MSIFVVLARKRWGEKCIPLTQVSGTEERAVNVAQKLYRDGGMNRALVVNHEFKIVFKIDRRCRCLNCQYHIDGRLLCEDCGRTINTNGYRVEEYQ